MSSNKSNNPEPEIHQHTSDKPDFFESQVALLFPDAESMSKLVMLQADIERYTAQLRQGCTPVELERDFIESNTSTLLELARIPKQRHKFRPDSSSAYGSTEPALMFSLIPTSLRPRIINVLDDERTPICLVQPIQLPSIAFLFNWRHGGSTQWSMEMIAQIPLPNHQEIVNCFHYKTRLTCLCKSCLSDDDSSQERTFASVCEVARSHGIETVFCRKGYARIGSVSIYDFASYGSVIRPPITQDVTSSNPLSDFNRYVWIS